MSGGDERGPQFRARYLPLIVAVAQTRKSWYSRTVVSSARSVNDFVSGQ